MEQITKPHCGARLDRLPDCRWHSSMFAVVAFGLLVCWSNAVGGLILAQLKELGWTDNSTTATFSAITTAGMFLGALVGGIIGDKTGRRNAFILYEAIHIAAMVVGAFSPNMSFLIACRFVMGVGLGALLVTLFAGFTEYMPGRNRGTWSSRVSFIGNWSYPLCSLIAMGLTPLISAEWNWRVSIGAANVDVSHIREYLKHGELDIIQAKYSILDRALETELLPLCREHGIVVQVYSPLEQGLLTGTITRDYVPGGARANKLWFQRENMLRVIDMLEQWQPLCDKYHCAVPTLALAWILRQSELISILSGATSPEQVRENIAALSITLSDDDALLMRQMAEALDNP